MEMGLPKNKNYIQTEQKHETQTCVFLKFQFQYSVSARAVFSKNDFSEEPHSQNQNQNQNQIQIHQILMLYLVVQFFSGCILFSLCFIYHSSVLSVFFLSFYFHPFLKWHIYEFYNENSADVLLRLYSACINAFEEC